jgi:DNA polymerase/3'-5' exonuclease PolX
MRKHALQRGLSLNEQGLINVKTKTPVDHIFKNENDIFTYLEFPFVDPEARIV